MSSPRITPPMHPNQTIHPILDVQSSFSGEIHEILYLISSVKSSDAGFEQRLRDCHVAHVEHHRSKQSAHELIVMIMNYRSSISPASSGDTKTRYLRLERFRKDSEGGSSRLWSRASRIPSASINAQRADIVKLAASLDEIGITDKYDLVRKFDVPPNKLTILEALVYANTLSGASTKYNNTQMCQFWATNFFLILQVVVSKRLGSAVTIENAPAVQQAGKFHRFPLVNPHTGRATGELFGKVNTDLRNLCALAYDPNVDWGLPGPHRTDGSRHKRALSSQRRAKSTQSILVDDALRGNSFLVAAEKSLQNLREQIRVRCTEIMRAQGQLNTAYLATGSTPAANTRESIDRHDSSDRCTSSITFSQAVEPSFYIHPP
ncbi:hypothetical protein BKA62DRAFT_705281 [Auriculariales sp. MPI-PUGE-AT-0066]|nr:hypothetical protein BKA62DRAFT_705281 [Auriculariales sp. MPI-PUGE-AT-0066]